MPGPNPTQAQGPVSITGAPQANAATATATATPPTSLAAIDKAYNDVLALIADANTDPQTHVVSYSRPAEPNLQGLFDLLIKENNLVKNSSVNDLNDNLPKDPKANLSFTGIKNLQEKSLTSITTEIGKQTVQTAFRNKHAANQAMNDQQFLAELKQLHSLREAFLEQELKKQDKARAAAGFRAFKHRSKLKGEALAEDASQVTLENSDKRKTEQSTMSEAFSRSPTIPFGLGNYVSYDARGNGSITSKDPVAAVEAAAAMGWNGFTLRDVGGRTAIKAARAAVKLGLAVTFDEATEKNIRHEAMGIHGTDAHFTPLMKEFYALQQISEATKEVRSAAPNGIFNADRSERALVFERLKPESDLLGTDYAKELMLSLLTPKEQAKLAVELSKKEFGKNLLTRTPIYGEEHVRSLLSRFKPSNLFGDGAVFQRSAFEEALKYEKGKADFKQNIQSQDLTVNTPATANTPEKSNIKDAVNRIFDAGHSKEVRMKLMEKLGKELKDQCGKKNLTDAQKKVLEKTLVEQAVMKICKDFHDNYPDSVGFLPLRTKNATNHFKSEIRQLKTKYPEIAGEVLQNYTIPQLANRDGSDAFPKRGMLQEKIRLSFNEILAEPAQPAPGAQPALNVQPEPAGPNEQQEQVDMEPPAPRLG